MQKPSNHFFGFVYHHRDVGPSNFGSKIEPIMFLQHNNGDNHQLVHGLNVLYRSISLFIGDGSIP